MVWAWRNRVLFSNRRKAGDAFCIHEQFYFDSVGMDVDCMPGLCYTGCNICHGLTELLIFHFIFWHISQYPLQPSSFMQVILGKRILPWHIRTVFFPKKIRRKKKRKETINLKHIFHPTESSIWQWEVGTCYSCRWPNSFSRGDMCWKMGSEGTFAFTNFQFDPPSSRNLDPGANDIPLERRLSLCVRYLWGRPAQSQELGFQGRILLPDPLGSPVTHTVSKGLNRTPGCPALQNLMIFSLCSRMKASGISSSKLTL